MSFKTLTCPKCGGRFDVDSILFVRAKEFPCPYCDAVLSFVNRERILRKEKTVAVLLLLLLFADFLIFCYLLLSVQDAYASILPFVTVYLNGLVLLGAIWILTLLKLSIRLVAVRSRPSCGNCGYTATMESTGLCPQCGAELLVADDINTDRCERSEIPKRRGYAPQIEETLKCMICLEDLRPHDTIARCPSCESTFHMTHLLEYLHVHRGCPTCGKPIDEIAPMLPYESAQAKEEGHVEASSS
jgi:hypothetical protein